MQNKEDGSKRSKFSSRQYIENISLSYSSADQKLGLSHKIKRKITARVMVAFLPRTAEPFLSNPIKNMPLLQILRWQKGNVQVLAKMAGGFNARVQKKHLAAHAISSENDCK